MINRKTILVLATTFPRWENDTTPPFVYELEKRLAQDFDIAVLVPHYPGSRLTESWQNLSVHRFRYFWPEKLQQLCYDGGIFPNIKKNKWLLLEVPFLLISEFIAAAVIIKEQKTSLIHAHWIIPQGIIALLLNRLFLIPYIITTHGTDVYGMQNPLFKFLKKIILQHASLVTVVSNDMKKRLLQLSPGLNIEVAPMGVDSSVFTPQKFNLSIREKYNIAGHFLLFVGRLAESKGVKYLLHSVAELVKIDPSLKLLVVGGGAESHDLQALSTKLKLQEHVVFTGPLPNHDLPPLYATADFFIGPSVKDKNGAAEGLGLTFVEASFSGCIPIGTNIGGITDVISNNQTGFIVRPKDSADLFRTVCHLFKNPDLVKKIKSQTRDLTIGKYDWSVVRQNYFNFYNQCL